MSVNYTKRVLETCDWIPVVSTVTNLTHLFARCFDIRNDSYKVYLNKHDVKQNILNLLPIINVINKIIGTLFYTKETCKNLEKPPLFQSNQRLFTADKRFDEVLFARQVCFKKYATNVQKLLLQDRQTLEQFESQGFHLEPSIAPLLKLNFEENFKNYQLASSLIESLNLPYEKNLQDISGRRFDYLEQQIKSAILNFDKMYEDLAGARQAYFKEYATKIQRWLVECRQTLDKFQSQGLHLEPSIGPLLQQNFEENFKNYQLATSFLESLNLPIEKNNDTSSKKFNHLKQKIHFLSLNIDKMHRSIRLFLDQEVQQAANQNDTNEGEECPMCLEKFQPNQLRPWHTKVQITHAEHAACIDCLSKHIFNQITNDYNLDCPLCRKNIEIVSPNNRGQYLQIDKIMANALLAGSLMNLCGFSTFNNSILDITAMFHVINIMLGNYLNTDLSKVVDLIIKLKIVMLILLNLARLYVEKFGTMTPSDKFLSTVFPLIYVFIDVTLATSLLFFIAKIPNKFQTEAEVKQALENNELELRLETA